MKRENEHGTPKENLNHDKGLYTIPAPQTIGEIIELKMFERKLTQVKLSRILGVTEAKLSRIINGKMSPDVAFLKALHEKLDVDAEFLLTKV
jgi:HTH-type transcriptional regulator/antitoxin HigA